MRDKPVIGVIGAANPSEQGLRDAEEVGHLVAQRGGLIICGGLAGVMEAACKGAHQAGGTTIGILPGTSRDDANPYVDIPIVTGLSHGRNLVIIRSAHLVIAIEGGSGTLSEIAFALKLDKPVITVNSWQLEAPLNRVDSAREAVEKAWQLLPHL